MTDSAHSVDGVTIVATLEEEGVTPSQLRVIAENWSRAGRFERAEAVYRSALAASSDPIETMYSQRGLANMLFDADREGQGREAYRVALDIARTHSSHPEWDAAETLRRWADWEGALSDDVEARRLLGLTTDCALKSRKSSSPRRALAEDRGGRSETRSSA